MTEYDEMANNIAQTPVTNVTEVVKERLIATGNMPEVEIYY